MSKSLLSLILFIAGFLHLFMPELFNSVIPFGHKNIINLLSGLLEVTLALGLLNKKFQDKCAQITALWFLLLLPIHINAAWNQIEIFGISHPFFLWGRTLFQFILYFWAISLQNKSWIISQTWRDVLFLHYKVDKILLQKHVPFNLDLYKGEAIVSVVSFTMNGIRFPFLPRVAGLSKLNELNLRTYVNVNGIKGVYFFTLDADLRPAIWIAKAFFSLPYRFAKIDISLIKNRYKCVSHHSPNALEIEAEIGQRKDSSSFDLWATERYGLFTMGSTNAIQGIVQHKPWELSEVKLKAVKDSFSSLLGDSLKATSFMEPSYCPKLKVRFRPFYNIKVLPISPE